MLLGLYHRIKAWSKRRHSYRFVLNPETIGSLCFLHRHQDHVVRNTIGGLVLTCLGGPEATLSYKASRRGNALVDRLAAQMSGMPEAGIVLRPFDPTGGSDERQFCSPGFNLPIGQFARTVYGEFPEYHTSGDTKDLMGIDQIVDSVDRIEAYLLAHEFAGKWRNTAPKGEPQLGRRGLYPSVNSPTTWNLSNDDTMDARAMLNMLLWVLNDADGERDALESARGSGYSIQAMIPVIRTLEEHGLIRWAEDGRQK